MVAPTIILLFSVGAIHESPAFIINNRSFSGGASPSPTETSSLFTFLSPTGWGLHTMYLRFFLRTAREVCPYNRF